MKRRLYLLLCFLVSLCCLPPRPLYAQTCPGSTSLFGTIGYRMNNSGGKYSLLALPFASSLNNAATLANQIGGVSALLKWNPATQSFRFFAPPSAGDNFALVKGDVVFVLLNTTGPTVFSLSGAVTAHQYNLAGGGFTFVGLPFACQNLTTAAGVGQTITRTTALLAWNETTQAFRFFAPPSAGDNFTVAVGAPLIVQRSAGDPVIWP